MGCTISCCAESGPAWLSFIHEITLCLEDMRPRCSARTEINHDPSATTSHCSEGVRMDARTVWFRETGEGRTKEQLLIETMFCVYYLSKSSAVLVTCALQSHSFFGTSSRPSHRGPCSLSELRFREIKGQGGRVAVVRFDRGDGMIAMSPETMRQLTVATRRITRKASRRSSAAESRGSRAGRRA